MSSLAELIYFHCPVPIQNILVTIYGFKLARERYSRESHRYLEDLLVTQFYSKERMQKLQEDRFVSLARHAIKTVPFYRDWARASGVKYTDICSLVDLEKFPIISKKTLKENSDLFISDKHRNKKMISLQTSGTSGSPLTVYCDAGVRTHHYAFFSRLRGWFGLNPRSKRATLFGRIIMLPEQDNPPFWRFDRSNNNLLMSSYHLSKKNLFYYYEKLVAYKPEEIIGYPSSLFQLARYIVEKELEPLDPKVVFTTAETLLSYQREVIEKAFSCPVIDQYGCTEMAFFASQCEHGTMHFHPEHGISEVVNKASMNAGGTLVVTGLVNDVMPLIRYEVGDRVVMSPSDSLCRCGRSFPILKEVEGRLDDVIYTKDGNPIGRLDPIFKGGSGVKEAQIIQKSEGDILILLVPDHSYDKSKGSWLVEQLEKRIGKDFPIYLKKVDEIPREPNGKLKAVKSDFRPIIQTHDRL